MPPPLAKNRPMFEQTHCIEKLSITFNGFEIQLIKMLVWENSGSARFDCRKKIRANIR